MKGRTVTIFSIFILVALMFAFFVFVYGNEAEGFIKNYIARITICGNIMDENDCYAKDFCEGIYAPVCPECEEVEFKQCQQVPAKVLIRLNKEKKLCSATGGLWYRNKLGNFCLCEKNGMNKAWDSREGCVIKTEIKK